MINKTTNSLWLGSLSSYSPQSQPTLYRIRSVTRSKTFSNTMVLLPLYNAFGLNRWDLIDCDKANKAEDYYTYWVLLVELSSSWDSPEKERTNINILVFI